MMISPTTAALAALLAAPSSFPAAAAAARRRAQHPPGGHNPFEVGPDGGVTDDANYGRIPHRGCELFLKTNHEPQDLPAVNFRGKGKGRGKGIGKGNGGQGGPRSLSTAPDPVLCTSGAATGYPCANVDLHSFIPLYYFGGVEDVPDGGGSDIWGWTDANTGREFAIMGLTSGTVFVEITSSTDPTYVGILPSYNGDCNDWRDIKTYSDHAFIVSEASGHGMQVFNLTQLLTVNVADMPMKFAETAHYNGFGNAHNIFVNEDTGYAYAVGTNTDSGGLHIVDITTPSNPARAGGFDGDGYTHDVQCVTYDATWPDAAQHLGKEICFCSNEDTLTIVDVSNKTSPVELSRTGYSSAQYTHQGWLTADGKYFIFNDELDEINGGGRTKTHVFNVEDLDSPSYKGKHDGTTDASDHNLYIKDTLVFEANYRAGLQVLQMGDLETASFTQVAHFDIYPSNDNAGFNGAWSNYPYFPSGTVVVSGIEQGLYVLRSSNNFGTGALRRRLPAVKPQGLDEPRSLLVNCMVEDFEAFSDGSKPWTNGGNCNTGQFEIGTPTQIVNDCVLTQPGGDHTTIESGAINGKALFTAPNPDFNPGGDDVDGGECSATSPTWTVTEDSDLSVWYFFGQRDEGSNSNDYFHLELSLNGGSTWTSMVSIGDVTWRARWTEATAQIPAGSDVQIRIRASDGNPGDLIEAGIDDIVICPSSSGSPTHQPTSPPTNSPTSSQPTNSPTVSPSTSPTTSQPTDSPTGSPTGAPTTSPTSPPTTSPVLPGICSDDAGRDCATSSDCVCGGAPAASASSGNEFSRRRLCAGNRNQQCNLPDCQWDQGSCVPAGTPAPSQSPTTSPTSSPSTPPTSHPTLSPSTSPTSSPSQSPTPGPTKSPTECQCYLTAFPTSSPTPGPTSPPTSSPSSPPTAPPSSSPTRSPSAPPTVPPTPGPVAVCHPKGTSCPGPADDGHDDCCAQCCSGACEQKGPNSKCTAP